MTTRHSSHRRSGSEGVVGPIDKRYLEQIFPPLHSEAAGQIDVNDFHGGVAIRLENLNPR